ncbi:MAG TPA: ABC transporter permease [Vicinamibacterales bacterium]|nr:ABC transporter permease [Vicinamibacterales bacterium]
MTPPADWKALVIAHARRAGANLPPATIDELAAHLEDLYVATRADGAPPDVARRRALRALEESALGSLPAPIDRRRSHARAADDRSRAARSRSLFVLYDLRMALRQFRHHPAFALLTVIVLGLGIGAAAAVYTIVDGVVLKPLPFTAPDRLVAIWDTNYEQGLRQERISPVNFMDARALTGTYQDAAAWWRPDVNLTDDNLEPVRIKTIEVSANIFQLLGVSPQIGPGFPIDGPFYDRSVICVISDRLWRSRYNADPGLIGKQIKLNDRPYTVAGVMPPRFSFPGDVDIWERLQWDLTQHSRGAHFMEAIARLAPGVDLAQASRDTNALAARLATQFPATNRAWSQRLIPLLENQLGFYRPALFVLLGAVSLLMLIGAFNVAGLLLTRSLDRRRELAVRVALGASPYRLVQELIAESAVLSAAGGLVGVALAWSLVRILIATMPVAIPRLEDVSLNWHVAVLILGIVTAMTFGFGLVPSLLMLSRRNTAALRDGDRTSTASGRLAHRGLVIAEVALACALVTASALLVKSVSALVSIPSGVSPHGVLTANMQLTGAAYRDWTQVDAFYATLLDRLRQKSGVTGAGATTFLPFEAGWRLPFEIIGRPPARPEDAPRVQFFSVTDGYLESLSVPLIDGRFFTAHDTAAGQGAVIVNRAFAKQFFPNERAVGQHLRSHVSVIGPMGRNLMVDQPLEIVGVTGDIANMPPGQAIEPAVFHTARQFPYTAMFITVRGNDPATLQAALRSALRETNASLPLDHVEMLDARFGEQSAQSRLLMRVLIAFGALAAMLAVVGIYGLLSWTVTSRQRELAVRLSLGARPVDVGRLVMLQGLALAGAGLFGGWLLVSAAGPLLSRVLFQVSPLSVTPMIAGGLAILVCAAISCLIPAVRASRTDPVTVLKSE